MIATRGWGEEGARSGTVGEISDVHGAMFFFKRQSNAYCGLKEGEQVKFRVQQNSSIKGKQAIYITREELPAAPSVKKQAPPVVVTVASATVKSNPTASQPHKVVSAAKQGQNAKSVLTAPANLRGRLNFASAVSGKIAIRTEDGQPRGELTAIVPNGISAVEARIKTMEESIAAMVKVMHERLPPPDHSPPPPLRM